MQLHVKCFPWFSVSLFVTHTYTCARTYLLKSMPYFSKSYSNIYHEKSQGFLLVIDFSCTSCIFHSVQIRAIVSKCTQGSMPLWSPRSIYVQLNNTNLCFNYDDLLSVQRLSPSSVYCIAHWISLSA